MVNSKVFDQMCKSFQDQIALLVKENARLVEQNNKLLDRLMSKNFETYATYKEQDSGPWTTDRVLDLTGEEANIGEVIENEIIG